MGREKKEKQTTRAFMLLFVVFDPPRTITQGVAAGVEPGTFTSKMKCIKETLDHPVPNSLSTH